MSLSEIADLLGPLRPYASWVFWNLLAPIWDGRFHWVLLLVPLAVAALFLLLWARLAPGAVASELFTRRVWWHPSARLDYRFYIVNRLLLAHLGLGAAVLWAIGTLGAAEGVQAALRATVGAVEQRPASGWALLGYTVAIFVAFDFGRFFAHWLMHRIPALWQFHKVHHAAEVLTPVTGSRAHPVEVMLDLFMRLLMSALVTGAFAYVYTGVTELTILGFNAAVFVVFYLLHHLQHSHIPLHFGPVLSRWWVSPLMHQVHHSRERQHWDRNMGFGLAVWDRLFGTLYVPRADERFRLGLPEGSGRFDTVWRLYAEPFVLLARGGWARRAVSAYT